MAFKRTKTVDIEIVPGHTVTVDALSAERIEGRIWRPYTEYPFSPEQPTYLAFAEADQPAQLLAGVVLGVPANVFVEQITQGSDYRTANLRKHGK